MEILNKLFRWYLTRHALPYWCVLIADLAICYLSGILVFWFYYHGAVTLGNIIILSKTIALYMVFNLIGFRVFHTYSGIVRYSSFVDLQRVAMAQTMSCFIAEIFHYVIYYADLHFIRLEGRQILLMCVIATILMWAMRVLVKTIYDVSFNSNLRPVLIYGAGSGGVALAKDIRNDKSLRFRLVGFVSNDRKLKNSRLMGVRVYQDNASLPKVIDGKEIEGILVSPKQNAVFRNNQPLIDMLISKRVRIFMVRTMQEWHETDDLDLNQLKEIDVSDLLLRDEIQTDMDAIGRTLAGRKVLITGSAGSIGSEIVSQVASFKPADMILIDQAETPQHDLRLAMANRFPGQKCETIVVSITQKERMEQIFRTYRPDYVFHAAAYKHVPMMEDNPAEAIHNNVYGTKIIADLCVEYGVRKMVMVSTDKAVNPTNVMGCSKRICEIYCQSLDAHIHSAQVANANGTADGKSAEPVTEFVTTRFGNVLGSNGSVIPLFEKQIKEGGPVTVTDPRIIRYFMLIPETCKLVLEAGVRGKGGQIFVFDMGKPVKIADLARRMIQLSGAKNVEIKYTGLRPGEKLYEELLSDEENTEPSFNKKIRIAKVRQYDYGEVCKAIDELIAVSRTVNGIDIISRMRQLVPEYSPANTRWSENAVG